MSEALFQRAAMGRHEAQSAGTTPAERVHDSVVTVMREVDVDLAARTPRLLSTDIALWADVVVTMGCGDECPFIPGRRYIDWDLPDPKTLSIEQVRALRDDISTRVIELVDFLDRKSF